jgi:hypothetical protein
MPPSWLSQVAKLTHTGMISLIKVHGIPGEGLLIKDCHDAKDIKEMMKCYLHGFLGSKFEATGTGLEGDLLWRCLRNINLHNASALWS